MKVKSAPARFKAAAGEVDTGEFEAIVSVFGNIDSWGDVVMPGAFIDTIGEWKASPNTLPILWSHRMDDPGFNIGEVLDIAELEPDASELPDWIDPFVKEHGGLWVKGRIDTGADASPTALFAHRLLKSRRVAQFSYAYDEVDAGWGKVDGREAWELRKLRLFEVSPTQVGANELTELLAAKTAVKVGRALSQKNEDKLRQAIDLLTEVVESTSSDDDGDEKAKGDEPRKAKPMSQSVESSRMTAEIARLLEEATKAETD